MYTHTDGTDGRRAHYARGVIGADPQVTYALMQAIARRRENRSGFWKRLAVKLQLWRWA